MSKRNKRILIIAATLLGICVILTWLYRLDELDAHARPVKMVPKPLRVSVHSVATGTVAQWVTAEGPAEAVRKSFLQFEEAGKVVFIGNDAQGLPLREGMRVFGPDSGTGAAGQLLARIDSRDKLSEVSQGEADYLAAQREVDTLRATMRQAEDDLTEARQDHDRKRKLLDQQFIAQSVYDEAKFRFTKATSALSVARLNIASAQARLNRARAELNKVNRSPEKLELRAPFNGVIARINVRRGDYFDPGNVVHTTRADLAATAPITIIDPSEMEITLHLPERDGRRIKSGQQVVVAPGFESWTSGMTLDTAPKVNGTVYSVSPQIDGKRRAIRVKIRLRQTDTTIPDGMFTSCWIRVAENADALRIPLSALLYDGSQPYAFVNDNGTARRRNLSLGLRNTKFAEVVSGLSGEEQVVCGGRKKLVNGAPIALVETSDSKETAHVGK